MRSCGWRRLRRAMRAARRSVIFAARAAARFYRGFSMVMLMIAYVAGAGFSRRWRLMPRATAEADFAEIRSLRHSLSQMRPCSAEGSGQSFNATAEAADYSPRDSLLRRTAVGRALTLRSYG